MKKLEAPFLPIDNALAHSICNWHNSDDEILYASVAFTSYALQQGHPCLVLEQAIKQAPYYPTLASKNVSESQWLNHLANFDLSGESQSPIVLENGRLYLRRYWQYENEVAQFIQSRQQSSVTLNASQIKQAKLLLAQFFPSHDGNVNWQKVAAANTLLNTLSIIVGGPGTGKTFTVTRLLALLSSLSESSLTIRLAAPTGKAAQRLAESIRVAKQTLDVDMLIQQGIPDTAQTLHRLLGVIPNQNAFRHNQNYPIDADVLVIDEVSMVDLPLMAKLFRAIKPTCKVILLGDSNQLPSVAAGSVLTDLMPAEATGAWHGYSDIKSKALKALGIDVPKTQANNNSEEPLASITQLLVSRRFDDKSGIGQLAGAIIKGDCSAARSVFETFEDTTLEPAATLEQTLARWAEDYYRPIHKAQSLAKAFAQLKKFRILTAHREGPQGVAELNKVITNRLNTQRTNYYQGQPVMVTQNHYGMNLFNGDIGLVWPNEDGQLMAWFEQETNYRPVSLGRMPNVETVYAMTIHKTQGSEFDTVALILPDSPSPLLTRELLYTGLTRAKQAFFCIGDFAILKAGIETTVSRWTGLKDKLYQRSKDEQ